MALPALWCLRGAFPAAKIIYIWQKNKEGQVTAEEMLRGSGLVDEFLCDKVGAHFFGRFYSRLKIWASLILRKVDLGIVLEEKHWPARRKRFLRFCGVKKVLGPDGKGSAIERDSQGINSSPRISESLVDVLKPLKIPLPSASSGKMTLPILDTERRNVEGWIEKTGLKNHAKPWIGIGPWSNRPVKRWPLENYFKVVEDLIETYGVMPIVFGGPAEKLIGQKLVRQWGRGYIAAGDLNVREGVELLKRCRLYLGNDTGTMHMAVAAGIPCVAIFSSIDSPGRWEPYGENHSVFRTRVECEGCMLEECEIEKMKCILSINPPEVITACKRYL